jgi:hypothetical protein
MGSCHRIAWRRTGNRRHFWCMGFWRRNCRDARQRGRLGGCDPQLPWCEGVRLGPHQRAILRPAQSAGPERRRHQRQRRAVKQGGQIGRQPVAAAHRLQQHLPATEDSEHVADVGAGLRAVAPVYGAGSAQAGEAFGGAWSGAPPAMHAAAKLAPDGRRTAWATRAGTGATARREPEVGIAAALFFRNLCGPVRLVTGGNGLCCDDVGRHGRS